MLFEYDIGRGDRIELGGYGQVLVEKLHFESFFLGDCVLVNAKHTEDTFPVPYDAFEKLYEE